MIRTFKIDFVPAVYVQFDTETKLWRSTLRKDREFGEWKNLVSYRTFDSSLQVYENDPNTIEIFA